MTPKARWIVKPSASCWSLGGNGGRAIPFQASLLMDSLLAPTALKMIMNLVRQQFSLGSRSSPPCSLGFPTACHWQYSHIQLRRNGCITNRASPANSNKSSNICKRMSCTPVTYPRKSFYWCFTPYPCSLAQESFLLVGSSASDFVVVCANTKLKT